MIKKLTLLIPIIMLAITMLPSCSKTEESSSANESSVTTAVEGTSSSRLLTIPAEGEINYDFDNRRWQINSFLLEPGDLPNDGIHCYSYWATGELYDLLTDEQKAEYVAEGEEINQKRSQAIKEFYAQIEALNYETQDEQNLIPVIDKALVLFEDKSIITVPEFLQKFNISKEDFISYIEKTGCEYNLSEIFP